MIKAPIPLSDPIHSPTIAPITAVVDAILNDEKSIGMERGNLKRQKVSHWFAERILNNSISLGLGEFSPESNSWYPAGFQSYPPSLGSIIGLNRSSLDPSMSKSPIWI